MVTNRKRGIFKGSVYLVNPKRDEIIGEKCYPSLSDLPERVETVLVAIPAAGVPAVIEEAGKVGTKVDKIATTVRKYGKPVTVCDMGAAEMAQTMLWGYEKRGLPSFDVPDRAARALWALSYYGSYLKSHSIPCERPS